MRMPEADKEALVQGIGFTDLVKRPSSSASNLKAEDFRRRDPVLIEGQ